MKPLLNQEIIHLKTAKIPAVKSTKETEGSPEEIVDYKMIGLSMEETFYIKQQKEFNEKTKETLKSLSIKEEDIKDIVFTGKFVDFKQKDKVVSKFKRSKRQILDNRPVYYRCYYKTIEQQKESNAYVNVAEDAIQSWKTALKAIKGNFGIIARIKQS